MAVVRVDMLEDFQQLLQAVNLFLALCAFVWVAADPCPRRRAAEARYWARKTAEWRKQARQEGRDLDDF
jgi:hypothetical protein